MLAEVNSFLYVQFCKFGLRKKLVTQKHLPLQDFAIPTGKAHLVSMPILNNKSNRTRAVECLKLWV